MNKMTTEELIAVDEYLLHTSITIIPRGQSCYNVGEDQSKSRQALMLVQRHKRKRDRYRELIDQGMTQRQIAKLFEVSEAQVRKQANYLGLINTLRKNKGV